MTLPFVGVGADLTLAVDRLARYRGSARLSFVGRRPAVPPGVFVSPTTGAHVLLLITTRTQPVGLAPICLFWMCPEKIRLCLL